MIPEDLRMVAGFAFGLFVATPVGFLLGAMMAGRGREDREIAVFNAGVAYEKNRRGRVMARLHREDLQGEEASELGRLNN